MKQKEWQGIKWLEFENLSHTQLSHGSFMRHGGYSVGTFSSLNVSSYIGDQNENVEQNLLKISSCLNTSRLYWSNQCHGTDIYEVRSEDETIPIADILSTSLPGIALMVMHADCQAGILYDPVQHALSLVHAGWRGSIKNVYAKAIDFMQKRYKTDPKDLLVGISPSLGPYDAEFVNYKNELPENFWEFRISPFHFDFWKITKTQLMACNVLEKNIEIAGISTYSSSSDFFSYRKEKNTGRNATVAILNHRGHRLDFRIF